MIRTQRSLSYGPLERQKLDLYLPSGRAAEPRPLIVFFYGGSWKHGERGIYRLWGRALAALGAVVAVPDYRLFPEARFPDFNLDGAAAVTHLLSQADPLNIDTSRVALMGHSAGAHMAASLVLDPTYLTSADPHQITHLCPISGPLSTDPIKFDSVREIFEGSDPEARRPIKLLSRATSFPKTLLLHGEKDTTVGVHNSINFANALTDQGADVTLKVFDHLHHVDILIRAWPILRIGSPVWPEIRSFLRDL